MPSSASPISRWRQGFGRFFSIDRQFDAFQIANPASIARERVRNLYCPDAMDGFRVFVACLFLSPAAFALSSREELQLLLRPRGELTPLGQQIQYRLWTDLPDLNFGAGHDDLPVGEPRWVNGKGDNDGSAVDDWMRAQLRRPLDQGQKHFVTRLPVRREGQVLGYLVLEKYVSGASPQGLRTSQNILYVVTLSGELLSMTLGLN